MKPQQTPAPGLRLARGRYGGLGPPSPEERWDGHLRWSPLIPLLAACGSASEAPMALQQERAEVEELEGPPPPPEEGRVGKKEARMDRAATGGAAPGAAPKAAAPAPTSSMAPEAPAEPAAPEDAEESAAPSRAWFPETFLFAPAVVTGPDGKASVSMRIPDRLTTWRVLGLAWSRSGRQAGDTAEVLGTLPVYVDPVVPPFLRSGDLVRLPVQVVNTTEAPLNTSLQLTAAGAGLSGGSGGLSLAAGASAVVWAQLVAGGAGEVELSAALGQQDRVVKRFPVQPTGQRQSLSRGGTLAAPRQLELEAPPELDPRSARATLLVHPGALAILRSEIASATARTGAAGTAYALLLSGRGPRLLSDLGMPVSATGPDPQARELAGRLRDMGLIGAQRAMKQARSMDTRSSALLAEPALWHPENAVLMRMGDRFVRELAARQLPDGTFRDEDGSTWTLQRSLALTAEATAAVRAAAAVPVEDPAQRQQLQRAATAVALRASGAMERHLAQIKDPYTAAQVLRSGAVTGSSAEKLRTILRAGFTESKDGSRHVQVGEGVLRPDGAPPSALEATALALLALGSEASPEEKADLGAFVVGSWRPVTGWGDGRADLLGMQAVLDLFREPLPERVTVRLKLDGQLLGEKVLDAAALREVAILDLPAAQAAGLHRWTVEADPPVPGLGYQLSLETWVPWPPPAPPQGLELRVQVPAEAQAGRPATLNIQLGAPAGKGLRLACDLPAGVSVDEERLAALVPERIALEVEEGRFQLDLPGQPPGKVLQIGVPVYPSLSGQLSSGPCSASVLGQESSSYVLPPQKWTIR